MAEDIPVRFPAGYASASAIAYTSDSGDVVLVGGNEPLPVVMQPAAVPASLAGTTGQAILAGPFAPAPGQPVILQLSGEWAGSVILQRSTDGGATRVPVTAGGLAWGVFTANACEPVWIEQEAAAELYLQIDVFQGTLSYRLSQ
jgi:hypothetical protein